MTECYDKKNVLLCIIDDEVDTCELYRKFFSKTFTKILVCHSIKDFSEQYDPDQPTVAVCDYFLEGQETGSDLLTLVNDNHWPISVLIITGQADDDVLENLHGAHAFAVFTKPVKLLKVADVMDAAIGNAIKIAASQHNVS